MQNTDLTKRQQKIIGIMNHQTRSICVNIRNTSIIFAPYHYINSKQFPAVFKHYVTNCGTIGGLYKIPPLRISRGHCQIGSLEPRIPLFAILTLDYASNVKQLPQYCIYKRYINTRDFTRYGPTLTHYYVDGQNKKCS